MPLALAAMMTVALRVMGLPTAQALAFAAAVGGLLAVYTGIFVSTITSGWFPSAVRTGLLTAVWAALIGTGSAGLTAAWPGVSGPLPLFVGIGVGLVALLFVRGPATRSVTSDSPLPSQVRTMSKAEADASGRAAETRLAQPDLHPVRRAATVIQRADAMRAQAFHASSPERLQEIVEILQPHVHDAGLPHGVRFAAVCGLVETRSLIAEITRDESGWDDDLALEFAIAEEPDAEAWERGRALVDLGDRETYSARGAVESGDDGLKPSRAALAAFREALAVLGEDAAFGPLLRTKIAQQEFVTALADRDGVGVASTRRAVQELRQTLKLYRGRRRDGRELVQLAIAWYLVRESDQEERVTAGLEEAESIGLALKRSRRAPEIAGSVRELLAEVTRLRLELTPDLTDDHRATLRARRIEHLAAAFHTHRQLSIATAAEPGRHWAEAVAAEGDPRAAANAYAELVRQVPAEALRRLRHRDRAAFVATQQGIATEAGHWLAADGRWADAVDAIEDARAILLGRRAGRMPDDLTQALAAHPALHTEYSAAVHELEDAERELYGDGDPAPLLRARSRYDQIRRAIAELPGATRATPGLQAARTVAPIVYLGAAEDAGYALVVGPDGAVTGKALPDAGRRALDPHLDRYRRFLGDGGWRCSPEGDAALAAVLGWAWDAVIEPIVDVVPRDATITLVPLGGLGLLPLHAAGRDDRFVDDVHTVAYAPSARMAVQARRDKARAGRRPATVLGVGVRDAPEGKPLPLVDDEVRAIARLVRATPILGATRAATLAALGHATTWHFACHGKAEPTEPLDSRLLVADGEISVLDILARSPGAYRLAVLSACETAVPDAARLDEMIGFPGALMQAGVAAVVASGWPVADRAAYAFAVRLHELLAGGDEPAGAVREARTWLRTATRGTLHDHFGPIFAPEPGTPSRHLARWRAQRPYRDPRHWAAFALTGS